MTGTHFRTRVLKVNVCLALLVWVGWLVFGGHHAFAALHRDWPVSLTMVFGSLVGGGTSEGGGAVAFPVFTKVLHIPPAQARVFAFAIQSVGMGAASISILLLKIPIEKRVLPWAGGAGIVGVVLSTFLLAPRVPAPLVKISFTVMVSSLAVALLLLNRVDKTVRHHACPVWGAREKVLLLLAGLVGGGMSGLVGCGENIVTFMVMVLLFRVSEKIVTPTTVILMTLVTWVGFALHAFVVHDFTPRVQSYWLAAAPIVAVGAPMGAYFCSRMNRRTIANILIGLISLEFVSTVVLIPMSRAVALTAIATLVVFGLLCWRMTQTRRYAGSSEAIERAEERGEALATSQS